MTINSENIYNYETSLFTRKKSITKATGCYSTTFSY